MVTPLTTEEVVVKEKTEVEEGIETPAAVKEKRKMITKVAVGIATVVEVKKKTEVEEGIERLAAVIKKTKRDTEIT